MRDALVLGATLDGYACEGGYDTDGGPATSFGIAQALGRCRPSLRSDATFRNLDRVVRCLADLGIAELRLGMEWARLEPRPGLRDEAARTAYERVLDAAAAAGLTVDVLVLDAVWPSWLGQEPWLSSWAPERFAAHAGWVASVLEGRVRCAVTVRRPREIAQLGWVHGVRPPFRRRQGADARAALDGLLLAHQLAVEAIASSAPSLRAALLVERADESWAVSLTAGRRGVQGLPRSSGRWQATPPFEWRFSADDVGGLRDGLGWLGALVGADRLGAAHELGAGELGWRRQLPTVGALPEASLHGAALHLWGALGSTGPLPGPTGLLEIDQHAGYWELRAPRHDVEGALRRATAD